VVDDGLVDAVASGQLDTATLDAALTRALTLRMRLGMFDPLALQPATSYGTERIGTGTAKQLAAVDAVAQGLVLLRNDAATLPLSTLPRTARVAVVGPHAVSQLQLLGDEYGDAYCPGVTTPGNRAAGCIPRLGESVGDLVATLWPDASVCIAEGVSVSGNDSSGIPAALACVAGADAVIVAVGNDNAAIEHEGVDRTTTDLPGLQQSFALSVLAAAAAGGGARTVLVLVNAGQLTIDALLAAPSPPGAIVEAFYPGFGGPALAAALWGQTNAWGRLPYTMYPGNYTAAVQLGSLAVAAWPGRTYRYLDAAAFPPLFAFGDGLSYTTFALSCGPSTGVVPAAGNASVILNCTSTNTGAFPVAGDEVLLVFHRVGADVNASVAGRHPVPVRSLVGFDRLSGIAPGASATTSWTLDAAAWGLVNEVGATVVYPGTHFLDVSPRPPAAPFTLTLTVLGSSPVVIASPPVPPSPTS
jgi:xylan 1,4-beta-xylosidase